MELRSPWPDALSELRGARRDAPVGVALLAIGDGLMGDLGDDPLPVRYVLRLRNQQPLCRLPASSGYH